MVPNFSFQARQARKSLCYLTPFLTFIQQAFIDHLLYTKLQKQLKQSSPSRTDTWSECYKWDLLSPRGAPRICTFQDAGYASVRNMTKLNKQAQY